MGTRAHVYSSDTFMRHIYSRDTFMREASILHDAMRNKPKESKFAFAARKKASLKYIAAALAYESRQVPTYTEAAHAFGVGLTSNSAGGKVANWLVIIQEFRADESGHDAPNIVIEEHDFGEDETLEFLQEDLDAESAASLVASYIGDSKIDSLQQALILPKAAGPVLTCLLLDEAPRDHGALRRYLDSKMVVLVQQLRSVDLVDPPLPMLCHPDAPDEAIDKMRAFCETVTAQADEHSTIIGFYLDIERRFFDKDPKLAPKLAKGLLLHILSAVSALEPMVLDGHDGLKTLLASVDKKRSVAHSPRSSPTGGGSREDAGSPLDATLAGPLPQSLAMPKAWVPPDQRGAEHEWG